MTSLRVWISWSPCLTLMLCLMHSWEASQLRGVSSVFIKCELLSVSHKWTGHVNPLFQVTAGCHAHCRAPGSDATMYGSSLLFVLCCALPLFSTAAAMTSVWEKCSELLGGMQSNQQSNCSLHICPRSGHVYLCHLTASCPTPGLSLFCRKPWEAFTRTAA